MKTLFIVRGYLAFSTRDNFTHGQQGKAVSTFADPKQYIRQASTLKGLVNAIRGDLCLPPIDDCIGASLDACGEPGRVDIDVYQINPGVMRAISKAQDEAWKSGRTDLWLTTYSFKVEITQHEVALTKLF